MQGTIRHKKAQLWIGAVGHGVVIVSVIALALLGQVVPEQDRVQLVLEGRRRLLGPCPVDVDERQWGHALSSPLDRRTARPWTAARPWQGYTTRVHPHLALLSARHPVGKGAARV